jgi:LPXTG-site transpeptidase (sortase) family protein
MKLHRKLTIIALLSIALGLAGLVPLAHYRLQAQQALARAPKISIPAVAPKPATKPDLITGKPTHLAIPSLEMDLAVTDGVYNAKDGSWTLSRDKAHYALPTVQPNNEEGNTLIYGHYRPEVFARLHKIAAGAQVAVDTDNGYRFIYTFEKTETVNPVDTGVFTYQGAPRLTIQTCTGAFMQNRQLFYFSLTSVDKR